MIEKLSLKMPPNSMFQPVTSEFRNNITFTEYLLGVLKKLNETISQVNANTSFIENYDDRIKYLETQINRLKDDIDDFEENVDVKFVQLENRLNNKINTQLIQIRNELTDMLIVYRAESKAYTDTKIAQIEDEIDQILIGQITVYDPTTGQNEPLQSVIDNLYNATRQEAISASEYDTLELTASDYDGYDITAFNYDYYGKTILTA